MSSIYTQFSDPLEWQGFADCLFGAASKLEASNNEEDWNYSTKPIYYMLVGLALENYYKGTIVALRPRSEVIENDKLTALIKTHNLENLAREAGVNTSDIKSFLDVLSDYVEWKGRYPLPTKGRDLVPKHAMQRYHRLNDGSEIPYINSIDHVIKIENIHKLIDQARDNFMNKRNPRIHRLEGR